MINLAKFRVFGNRPWVSITIALFFACLAGTGLILYMLPYNSFFSGLHTWLGFCFIAIIVLHFINNFRSLFGYLKKKHSFLIIFSAGLLCFTIVVAVYYRLAPVSTVLDFGNKLRKTVTVTEGHFQTILINQDVSGKKLIIEVRVGDRYRDRPFPFLFGRTITSPPQMAFWVEDTAGNYIRTLYVTAKTGYPIIYPVDRIRSDTVSRPEALPYWSHKRSEAYGRKDFSPEVDAVTGATPHGHFNIETDLPGALRKFRVLAEINRSFDFNDYYTKNKYPNDPVYSGDGNPGQPSVIYSTDINLDSDDKVYIMKLIGHGHYSGADGKLYTDMTGIDSALQIIQRMIVEVH